jgi:anti-sigma regulatory factor (Ser/Thr protein kinase)
VSVSWTDAHSAGWRVLDLQGTDEAGLADARRWADTIVRPLGQPYRIDMLMVVGELLDNAYQHAGGPLHLHIRLIHDPCDLTVAVADADLGEPRLRVPDRGGGRGLLLVDRICHAWGVSRHDDGKLVWGRIDCEP